MFCQELAAQIASNVEPVLTNANVRTFCVGIGTLETARKFCAHVPFPERYLYTDPDNAIYDALGLRNGVDATFFSASTPFAILDRIQKDGAADLIAATKRWKPWLPPKSSQGLQVSPAHCQKKLAIARPRIPVIAPPPMRAAARGSLRLRGLRAPLPALRSFDGCAR